MGIHSCFRMGRKMQTANAYTIRERILVIESLTLFGYFLISVHIHDTLF